MCIAEARTWNRHSCRSMNECKSNVTQTEMGHCVTLEEKSTDCDTDELEVIVLTEISWSQTGNCLILLSEIPTVIKGD